MWRITGILFLLATLLSVGNGLAVAQQDRDQDEEHLTKVKLFTFGGIGRLGMRSKEERTYDNIMSRPSREAILERVFAAGTVEAKCYALVGIYILDRARYGALAAAVRSSKEKVNDARGCVFGETTLGEVIRNIDAGKYAHYV
jgi:hypothetical protein